MYKLVAIDVDGTLVNDDKRLTKRIIDSIKKAIQNNEYECGSNDLFAIRIIFKSLLNKDDFNKMFIKIENMLSDVKQELYMQSYQNLLQFMGFPKNYDKLNEID